MLTLVILGCLAAAPHANTFAVYAPRHPSSLERLAAREIRRYVYLRTGVLAPVIETDKVPALAKGVVVGRRGRPATAALGVAIAGKSSDAYRLKTVRSGRLAVVTGATDVATLYGAYAFAEKLGVRFYLHGDTVPDARMPLKVPQLDVSASPLFELRGIQPFHDFPEGPDWWNKDDYLAIVGQLPKLRMNFIGLHTYPEPIAEPTVWIGRASDVEPGGRVAFAYPACYQNTMRGSFGYARKATSAFGEGAAQLFDRDDYGNDVMAGLGGQPETPPDCRTAFDRAGLVLKAAFGEAKSLGVKTCLGTETPLTIPKAVRDRLKDAGTDPDSLAAKRLVYEGLFRRIMKTHSLDYYWFWTPEGWTWGGNTEEDLNRTLTDLAVAREAASAVHAPFKLATCGWVLGPQKDRGLFGRVLPKDVAVACINRQVGFEPVDPGFADVKGRGKWAIPWMEDDPALTMPQLWAGRMRRDAQDALRYGCTGLMGIHWRTRILGPNVLALARGGWDQRGWPSPTQGPFVALGGNIAEYGVPIAGTQEPTIYQTVRWNVAGYRIRVPKGVCDVTLKFCELAYDQPGKRVFDVSLNGSKVIESLDVFAKVGKDHALDYTYRGVKAQDGVLKIAFAPKVEYPCIAAIVVKTPKGEVKINCGGPAIGGYLADRPGSTPRPGVSDLYLDWATAEFGPEAAKPIARIFTRLDGELPRPMDWVDGPGGFRPDDIPWSEQAPKYAFVDELARWRGKVRGAGDLARFDYWVSNFKYLRAAALLRCAWGQLEARLKAGDLGRMPEAEEETRAALAAVRSLLLQTVSTTGEMGTVANWEQHNVAGPESAIARARTALKLPAAVPALSYSGATRIIVPTVRTRVEPGVVRLKVIVLSKDAVRGAELLWRPLGRGKFQPIPLKHVSRGVFEVDVPAKEDFEYYVKAGGAMWPPTAPSLNQSVVVLPIAARS